MPPKAYSRLTSPPRSTSTAPRQSSLASPVPFIRSVTIFDVLYTFFILVIYLLTADSVARAITDGFLHDLYTKYRFAHTTTNYFLSRNYMGFKDVRIYLPMLISAVTGLVGLLMMPVVLLGWHWGRRWIQGDEVKESAEAVIGRLRKENEGLMRRVKELEEQLQRPGQAAGADVQADESSRSEVRRRG